MIARRKVGIVVRNLITWVSKAWPMLISAELRSRDHGWM